MTDALKDRLRSALDALDSEVVQIHYLKGGQISGDSLTIVEEYDDEAIHHGNWGSRVERRRIRRTRIFGPSGLIESISRTELRT